MKVGNRLISAREDKKMTQTEMAELLGVSTSVYSRLERNETSVALEQVASFADILQIPIQDFLPDTMSINHSNNETGQVGFVIGNFYNYAEGKELAKENQFLKEKVELLESKIKDLEEINNFLREKRN